MSPEHPARERVATEEPPVLRTVQPKESGNRPPRRVRWRTGGSTVWTASILALVAALVATALVLPNLFVGDTRNRPHVVASLPVWNLAAGTRTIAEQAASLTAASPSLYEVGREGEIVRRPQPDGVSVDDGLATLRQHDVPIVPIVSNTRDGDWDPALIQRILHNPDLVARHIEALVALVRQEGFAGVDIDYEELTSADRDAFSRFVDRLADALHSEEKTLSVDVFAKASDQGYDERNRAQDYAALGRAADQVRIMAYDRHWQGSAAGPVAPVSWVRSVLAYAVGEIPAEKVVLGIPTYGYWWDGAQAHLVSWLQAYVRSQDLGVPVLWDPAAQSPWLTYRDAEGVEHTIWFENSHSIQAKLGLAQSFGVGGVFLWLVSDEDDGVWPVVSAFADGEDLKGAW